MVGNLKAERNPIDDTVIAQLDGTGGDSSKVTFGNGAIRRYTWPSSTVYRVTEFTDALGRKVTYGYSANGQGYVNSFKDPAGRTTAYSRGARGVLLSRRKPDNSVVAWTRDSFGMPLTYTDELGRGTTWTRDAKRRVTRTDYPDQRIRISFRPSLYI